ncbi:hypothetical protein CO058_00380 [candidate division WWE3 bacterium CG_4_9_14_0_2_um_filter_35_11]|uniref:Type 4 fimbrial biogenesis protein PilX N-terminal domain-containing protein n=1 Tax=candidate division WWE3 bacterium CG_4_9_14_0_2_um_filter_35_11 TaxID=1975077 RepID=A0A2M8EMP9_UNCKA|nr:MAG: hypothetical protein CO058_00380 [candidate division WWE3 bacterium CG_4_9_14_0_2_um_filter_35_11]
MMIKHKSGQAALIIVIVTMVTALGVAISSITQSNLNLKETVYSTQSDQAQACSEAGSERALSEITSAEESGGSVPTSLTTEDTGDYEIDNCTYNVTITNYPCSNSDPLCDNKVFIPSLSENSVQQINVNSGSGKKIDIQFTNNSVVNASLAVYLYKSDSVQRLMYHCGSPSDAPNDFTSLSPTNGVCTISDLSTVGVSLVRFRPLYTSMSITVSDTGVEGTQSGYLIQSKGISGSVQRNIAVYRYFSQLPSVFDEAVVSLGNVELN